MKKFYSLLTSTIIVTCFSLKAQPPIQWQKSYGGTSDDFGSTPHQTIDGGYIVVGFSNSNDGDVSGNHGGTDCWVTKLSNNGTIQWQKSYGGSGDDLCWNIEQTPDTGYIMVGQSKSNDGDVSGHHGSLSNADAWVVKIDQSGNIQWQKSLGGSGIDNGTFINQTNDGGYMVSCWTYSNDGDVSGNHGSRDYWLVKLSAGGSIQWQKCYGGSGDDAASCALQTPDGRYIVGGASSSNDGDVSGNHGGTDCWTLKLDSAGNILWQKCTGGSSTDWNQTNRPTADGGCLGGGYTYSNDGDVSGNHGARDGWVYKLDSAGNLQWQKCLGGSALDQFGDMTILSNGQYLVGGRTYSNDGDVSGNHGGMDYWLVNLSTSGNLNWQKCLGGTADDGGSTFRETNDGGLIVSGDSKSNDGDATFNHGGSDFWVIKLGGLTSENCITLQPDSNNSEFADLTDYYPNGQDNRTIFGWGAWTIGGTPYLWHNFMKFDLSAIPSNAIVDSAFISLYGYTDNGDTNAQITGSNESLLLRVTSAWNEFAVTWNTQPTTTTVDSVYLPASDSAGQNYLHYDIKNMAQYWISNPANNFGFMSRLITEQYWRRLVFCSPVYPDYTKHPKLEICYHVPSPECTMLILQPDSAAGKDAYINSESSIFANNNYGDYPRYVAGMWTWSGNPGIERSLVEFNLSSIPPGSIINSAYLSLYDNLHDTTSGPNDSWLERITQPWTEFGVTWNNQPATTTQNRVYLPASTSNHQDYPNIDVTALVQDMINNPSSSFGFMIKLNTESYYRALGFCSSDYSDSTKHPKLEICYKFSPEGVSEVSNIDHFIIYPNPSSGSSTISFQNKMQNGVIEIFNSIGQEIYSEIILNPVSKKEINLNAAAGIYFVKVSDGKKVITKKLIIE